jgi:hypothetical protein
MCLRATLHRLVDSLPEEDLTTAGRLLIGLTATADFSRDGPDLRHRDGFCGWTAPFCLGRPRVLAGRLRFWWDGALF